MNLMEKVQTTSLGRPIQIFKCVFLKTNSSFPLKNVSPHHNVSYPEKIYLENIFSRKHFKEKNVGEILCKENILLRKHFVGK